MKIRLAVVPLLLLTSSCATFFSGKTYQMNVCAIQHNSSLVVDDSTYQLPAKITVSRSMDDLPVTLKTDSIQKEFVLKASPTRMTVFANLPYLYLMPVAYAVDHYSQKRYYYGQDIILDVNDQETVLNNGFFPKFSHRIHDYFQRPYPGEKGQINFIFGSPFQNNLYMDNTYGAKDYNFFGGAKLGMEYFYSDNRYWSLTASYVRGVVFKRSVDGGDGSPFSSYADPYSLAFELKNNHAHKRLTFGYGINYSVNSLIYGRETDHKRQNTYSEKMESTYVNHSVGVALSTHFRFHEQVFLGINYRPNILQLQHDGTELRYEHLISLELLFKIRIKK